MRFTELVGITFPLLPSMYTVSLVRRQLKLKHGSSSRKYVFAYVLYHWMQFIVSWLITVSVMYVVFVAAMLTLVRHEPDLFNAALKTVMIPFSDRYLMGHVASAVVPVLFLAFVVLTSKKQPRNKDLTNLVRQHLDLMYALFVLTFVSLALQ
jgi:hypothetical protein